MLNFISNQRNSDENNRIPFQSHQNTKFQQSDTFKGGKDMEIKEIFGKQLTSM